MADDIERSAEWEKVLEDERKAFQGFREALDKAQAQVIELEEILQKEKTTADAEKAEMSRQGISPTQMARWAAKDAKMAWQEAYKNMRAAQMVWEAKVAATPGGVYQEYLDDGTPIPDAEWDAVVSVVAEANRTAEAWNDAALEVAREEAEAWIASLDKP